MSKLVEPGPPPLVFDWGILLIYNGADYRNVYSVGWVVFDRNDPTRVIARCEKPILRPEHPWELKGQVPNVVFAEGLVRVGGMWYLYYDAADTYVCLAVAEERRVESRSSLRELEVLDPGTALLLSLLSASYGG